MCSYGERAVSPPHSAASAVELPINVPVYIAINNNSNKQAIMRDLHTQYKTTSVWSNDYMNLATCSSCTCICLIHVMTFIFYRKLMVLLVFLHIHCHLVHTDSPGRFIHIYHIFASLILEFFL